jgi:ppGpp synthetase/RelA/SpoT-type nucleotidyltranferase
MSDSISLSKNQIDALGQRLRKGTVTEEDLRLLDHYRRSFNDAYEAVVTEIRALAPTGIDGKSLLEPTGRPAKSTTSIIGKLQRESIRLSQMQDIGGCRLTVEDIDRQDYIVGKIANLFEKVSIVDRRDLPSHGYRAVHLIVNYGRKPIEVQVRTSMQHLWAELSEKFSDLIDSGLKYGSGDEDAARVLEFASDEIRRLELDEKLASQMLSAEVHRALEEGNRLSVEAKVKILDIMERMKSRKERIKNRILKLADATIDARRARQ